MNKIILGMLFFVSTGSLAGDNIIEKRLLAKTMFDRSIVELSKQEAACKAERKILPVEKIRTLGITKKEQAIALQYYYSKAMLNCSDEQLKNYLVASALLNVLDKNQRAATESGNELIIQSHIDYLNSEIKFNTLTAETKAKLANVKELLQPFEPMIAAKALGL